MKILDEINDVYESLPGFVRFILISIILFVVGSIINGPRGEPDPALVEIIRRNGRDAVCSDLIGRWSFEGSRESWDFKDNDRFIGKAFLYYVNAPYSCDNTERIAGIPYYDGESVECCISVYLGKLSGDRMLVYIGSDRDVSVLIKE